MPIYYQLTLKRRHRYMWWFFSCKCMRTIRIISIWHYFESLYLHLDTHIASKLVTYKMNWKIFKIHKCMNWNALIKIQIEHFDMCFIPFDTSVVQTMLWIALYSQQDEKGLWWLKMTAHRVEFCNKECKTLRTCDRNR